MAEFIGKGSNGPAIGFIGAGNMAEAILRAILSKGDVKADNVIVSAPSNRRLGPLKTELGIHTTNDNATILNGCRFIFMCVKPHIFAPEAEGMAKYLNPDCVVISVMAGLTIDFIMKKLGSSAVVRSMPNTPCLVGEGACVYTFSEAFNKGEESRKVVHYLIGCLGVVREVPEAQINAAAAVMGSGPAYIYSVIEAMSDGGVMMGLPRELAQSLAAQTVHGAAMMVQKTGKHPGQLKDEVCSPGGTTIAAMYELEKGGVRASFMSAVKAGTERAAEVLKQQKEKEGM